MSYAAWVGALTLCMAVSGTLGFFPTDTTPGRWLVSSPITLESWPAHTEFRIAARRLGDGRTEAALQYVPGERGGSGVQQAVEAAAEDARRSLSERRALLDSADVIAAFAREMSEFLRTSELTESKAFIRSFVKEIVIKPGTATIRYTIPTPPDSPIRGGDAAEVELPEGVRSTVQYGCRGRNRTSIKGSKVPCATVTPPGSGWALPSIVRGSARLR